MPLPRAGLLTRRLLLGTARLVLLAALGLGVMGCEDAFRSETVIFPDGEVSRAIYQPEERTPAEGRDPKLWEQVTFAPPPHDLDRRGWPPSLTHFPVQGKDDGHPYFVARGKFRSPAVIPGHLVMNPPEDVDVPSGRLVRDYVRRDYGFLVEHRWKETLTDCVSLNEMRQARRELVDLLADLGGAVFSETLGTEYDGSGLVTWLKAEGNEWLAEVTDTLLVLGANKNRPATEWAWDEIAMICERHGLTLKRDGEFLKGDAGKQRIEEFLTTLVLKHLHRKDGQPVGREELTALRDRIQSWDQPGEEQKSFEASIGKVIARDYGGKEVLQRRIATLTIRIGGLYLLNPFGPGRFRYDLTVPGEVVETNGQLLAPNRVRWRFGAAEAYPFGFTMDCRSFATDPEALELLPGRPLADREAMLRFTEIVEGQEPLIKALRECRRQGSLKPLAEYRTALSANSKPLNEVEPLYELYKFLSINPD